MMSRRNESSPSTYRVAMAGQNRGVSMMAQGHFYEALQIFKDSFSFISTKEAIPTGGDFEGVFLPPTYRYTSYSYDEQLQEFARSQTASLYPIQICPCDDGDLSAMKNALPSVSVFSPINLRSRELYDLQEGSQQNVNLSIAIMMYNHGLAHLLAHVQDKRASAGPTKDGRKLLRGAVVSLNSAQVMIDRHLATIDENSFEKLRTLLVLAMILKSLIWMSCLDNQKTHVEQGRAMLSRVLSDIKIYQDRLQERNVKICNHPTASAA